MGKIQRLPPDLADQIAAGEVVERPASVIKELVENSIDAGARRVTITVEQGGKRLIRVEDDGEGMDAADAQLAVERHATSKLRTPDDLGRIATLGFRGEALPAMASVSRFTLRTRRRDATAGVEVSVEGGAPAAVREVGAPAGTSVEVRDLFFNLPARRKFLKSDAAEMAQVTRVVTQMALCYIEVGFALVSPGRKRLEFPPVASLPDRLFQVYGDRPDLVPVARGTAGLSIHGMVAALASNGLPRGPQHVFVNRRMVRDKTIAHAIGEAYSAASIKERSPEVHLFLEMPLDAVDVNVHPTKAEVRFRDQSFIHQSVRMAVADALGGAAKPALPHGAARPAVPQAAPLPLPTSYPTVFPSRWAPAAQAGITGVHLELPRSLRGPGDWRQGTGDRGQETGDGSLRVREDADQPVVAPGAPGTLMPLGQFRDTFIVAVDEEGIAIIDQHVAHERVLFERITDRLTSGWLESQGLLEPMLVEVAPDGHQALLAHADDLARLGFEVEDFGGDAIRVVACPALLSREESRAALLELAQDLEQIDHGSAVVDAVKRIAATMACHAAVKANYPLTHEKMLHILDGVQRTAYSTVCPHGRPVMFRLTRQELERWFERA
jgi:DNA mismatch repair protein MutL